MQGIANLKPEPLKATHAATLKGLYETCPAYQELRQFVTDQLTAVNFILEASVVRDADFMSKIVTKHLREVQRINQAVMARMGGEGY